MTTEALERFVLNRVEADDHRMKRMLKINTLHGGVDALWSVVFHMARPQ